MLKGSDATTGVGGAGAEGKEMMVGCCCWGCGRRAGG